MSRPSARFVSRLLALLGGLVVAVLGVELVARAVSPWPAADAVRRTSLTGVLFVPHEELVQVPRAGAAVTIWDPEYQAHVRFNHMGLRGPEPTPMGPAGRRVLVVGDSFALGMQVDEADTFVGLMQSRLSEDRPTQVWNAGVDDYSTWQAHGRAQELMERGVELDALVLLFYMGNDLVDNLRKRQKRRPDRGQSRPRPLPAPPSVAMAWISLITAQWQLADNPGHRDRLTREVQLWCDDGAVDMILDATRRSLADLARTARRADLPLMVALAPPQIVVEPAAGEALATSLGLTDFDPTRVTRRVVDVVPRSAHVVDLTEPLQAAARTRRLHLRHDGHWTPAGHAVVADALSTEILALLEAP